MTPPIPNSKYNTLNETAMSFIKKDNFEWMCDLVHSSLDDCNPEDIPSAFITKYDGTLLIRPIIKYAYLYISICIQS
jgi:hypothetical protein